MSKTQMHLTNRFSTFFQLLRLTWNTRHSQEQRKHIDNYTTPVKTGNLSLVTDRELTIMVNNTGKYTVCLSLETATLKLNHLHISR